MERENDGSTIIHKKEVNMLSLECTKEREIRNRNGGYSCWVWVTSSSSVALECHKNNTQKKMCQLSNRGLEKKKNGNPPRNVDLLFEGGVYFVSFGYVAIPLRLSMRT